MAGALRRKRRRLAESPGIRSRARTSMIGDRTMAAKKAKKAAKKGAKKTAKKAAKKGAKKRQ